MKEEPKIDNKTFIRNTLKSDPSQIGTPVPFQKQFSGYEENIPQKSSFWALIFLIF